MSAAQDRYKQLLDEANIETLYNADSAEARIARARLTGFNEGIAIAASQNAESVRLTNLVEQLTEQVTKCQREHIQPAQEGKYYCGEQPQHISGGCVDEPEGPSCSPMDRPDHYVFESDYARCKECDTIKKLHRSYDYAGHWYEGSLEDDESRPQVEVNEDDIRIDVFGPSSLWSSKVDNAVKVTHLPTGTVVYSSTERGQQQNKERALRLLREKLNER